MVDIDAKNLLEDIVSSVPEKSQTASPDREDMKGSPTRERFSASHRKHMGTFKFNVVVFSYIFVPFVLLRTSSYVFVFAYHGKHLGKFKFF